MAGLRGVEPPTTWFVARCSIQLSYRPADTTHAFPLDYDTLPATSTAPRTVGAGFLPPCIYLCSSAFICRAFELTSPAIRALRFARHACENLNPPSCGTVNRVVTSQ